MGNTGSGAAFDQLGQQASDSGHQVRISHPEIASRRTAAGGLKSTFLQTTAGDRVLLAGLVGSAAAVAASVFPSALALPAVVPAFSRY